MFSRKERYHMAIRFIVDSASDLLPEECRELGILHIPMPVTFGGTCYADAVDLTHREFYEKLIECTELPTSSQASPVAFEEAFRQVTEAGDTAICIVVSGGLSGTYQSAMIAAEPFGDSVIVIDSESVCVGQRILTLRGLELAAQGLDAAAIAAALNEEKKKIRVLALLDTLEYLKKGGRISAATAFAGSLLSIKPVIAIENGAVTMAGKARGSKQGNNLLRELVAKCGGINFEKPFAVAYSGLSDTMLRKYVEDSGDMLGSHAAELKLTTVGCAIGVHAGPGAVAVAFFEH